MHGDKADKNVTVSGTELFSFGAGEFVKQAEASDVMGDHEGRWIAFGLNGDSFVRSPQNIVCAGPSYLEKASAFWFVRVVFQRPNFFGERTMAPPISMHGWGQTGENLQTSQPRL